MSITTRAACCTLNIKSPIGTKLCKIHYEIFPHRPDPVHYAENERCLAENEPRNEQLLGELFGTVLFGSSKSHAQKHDSKSFFVITIHLFTTGACRVHTYELDAVFDQHSLVCSASFS